MNQNIDSGLILHMVFNTIRSYNLKFRNEFGELVICGDGADSWRKQYYPHYKASRVSDKKKSPLDWVLIYDTLNILKEDIPQFFGYRYLNIPHVEADDIIATICKNVKEPHVIISNDQDFYQLQKFDYVSQYNPRLKRLVKCKNPEEELFIKLLTGDRGDGVPNFLSQGDSFVKKVRQKTLTDKKIAECLRNKNDPRAFCEKKEHIDNLERNRQMIDMTYIPEDIEQKIIEAFEIKPTGNKKTILKYLMDHKMRNLIENVNDF